MFVENNSWYYSGYSLLSAIAYALPDWRMFTRVNAFLTLSLVPIIILLPTSPKWLHSKRRIRETTQVLQTFAKNSGSRLPDNIEDILTLALPETRNSRQTSFRRHPIIRLISSPHFQKVTLLVGYIFVATTLVYYGLSYNAANLPGNLYTNHAINGLVEFIGCFLVMILMNYG